MRTQVPVVGTVMCTMFFRACVPAGCFIVPSIESCTRMLFQCPLGLMRACVSAASASGRPGCAAIACRSLLTAGTRVRFASAVRVTSLSTQAFVVEPCGHVRTVVPVRQTFPSMGGFEHTPVPESQVPGEWQASSAVQVTGDPTHAPPWQPSVCVQALLSLHAAPSGFGGGLPQPAHG